MINIVGFSVVRVPKSPDDEYSFNADSRNNIVAAQSSLDWGDKVITQNHPPTHPTHHKLTLHKQKVT